MNETEMQKYLEALQAQGVDVSKLMPGLLGGQNGAGSTNTQVVQQNAPQSAQSAIQGGVAPDALTNQQVVQAGNMQELQKGLLSSNKAADTASQMQAQGEQNIQQGMQSSATLQNQRDAQMQTTEQQASQALQKQQQEDAANKAKILQLGIAIATGGAGLGAEAAAGEVAGEAVAGDVLQGVATDAVKKSALQQAINATGDYLLRGVANNMANNALGTNGISFINKKLF